jgi:class 3 adenylate cyclase/PAS domain-containing protein
MTPLPRSAETGRRALREAVSLLRESGAIAADARAMRALDIVANLVERAAPASHEPPALHEPPPMHQPPASAERFADSPSGLDAALTGALSLAVEVMDADLGFIVPRGEGRITRVSNVRGDGPPCGGPLGSIACAPIHAHGESVGALYLGYSSPARALENSDPALLLAFAQHAALAIDYARMFGEERERARSIIDLQAFQTLILEAIASGVITLASDRSITTFNRSAEATLGVSAYEMVGKNAAALGAFVPSLLELLGIFFESGAVQLRAEVEAHHYDATDRTLEIQLAPLGTAEGLGAVIVVTDLTKYRRLELAHEAQVTKARRIAETFSRYLAPHVVEILMTDPGSVKLGGDRQRGTMLFADIRGFTSLAARLPAERVVEILNAYFEEAVRIVFKYEGLLDKFYGDGLMAVFGPPRARGDDASRAVAAAIALHEAVERLAPQLDYPLRISVGLATGEVVAGHIGSTKRMDYTVIGDAVNLASGLQAAAPPGTIYCDEETIARAGEISLPMERRTVRLKGRSGFRRIYVIAPPRAAVIEPSGAARIEFSRAAELEAPVNDPK